jgi:prepilin-type processing-associated H-X9-DG protein
MIFESDGGWNANGGAELMITRGHGGRGRLTGVAFADGSVQVELLSQVNTLVWNP